MKVAVFDGELKIKDADSFDVSKLHFANIVDTLMDYQVIITKNFALRRDMIDLLTSLKFVLIKEDTNVVDVNYLQLMDMGYYYYENEKDVIAILSNLN